MIKQIKRIKNFGIFSDFTQHGETKDFTRYNLIYGWNYSGKTTLSRVFRCFEQECIPPDFHGASFEFVTHDESILNEQYLEISHSIRVFNSDFVDDNLKWNNDLEPIFLIGQDNIDLQDELTSEKDSLIIIDESVLASKKLIEITDRNINETLTATAREIKTSLSIPDYNKTKLGSRVDSIKEDYLTHILSDLELPNVTSNYFNVDKKDKLTLTEALTFDTNKLNKIVNDIITKTVVSRTIDRLKDNTITQDWVKCGLSIHEVGSTCEFCGGIVTSDVIETLNAHFSDNYNNLIDDIDSTIKALEAKSVKYEYIDAANLYLEFKSDYQQNVLHLANKFSEFNEQLLLVIKILSDKKNKLFDKMKEITLIDYTKDINLCVEDINVLLRKHNTKTDNFELTRLESLEKLILHNAAKYIENNSHFYKLELIKAANLALENTLLNKESSQKRIDDLELLLSETVKGADKINEYLLAFFGKDDLKIIVNNDNKFQLFRKGKIARNLSEGEKTAIAFAYFVTKLEDKNTTVANSIIYLDDPISSLDSNHIFNIYAFIKTKLSPCKQLFVSTHNSEFFNIIKDWYSDLRKNQKAVFLIERSNNASGDKSSIKNIPLLMDKYKSEYVYLFSVIKNFKDGPSTDFHMLYNLPNLMRRFLESYASFKIPKSLGLGKKLDLLISDPIKSEKINKFVNQNSHSSSINTSMQFPNLTECSDVIDLIFEMIMDKDETHYQYLVEAISENGD